MRGISLILLVAGMGVAAQNADVAVGMSNIERAAAIADATWNKTMKGSNTNLWMADVYDTSNGWNSGSSDVWPYTAAIEAHCSLLEAIEAASVLEQSRDLANSLRDKYTERLNLLITNLAYYRGSYRLSSYATTNKLCSPYAVPRASAPNTANVTGILNVYDDQMWLCRELIRAYRVTDNQEYLDLAAYLADYVLEGWDCWRDDNGNEYGGITWGPGYNSKHACSNAPIIQPLCWLSEIYKETDETIKYYYRDEANAVRNATVSRSEYYLDFAKKVYDWQRDKLLNKQKNIFYDMMGADGTILVSRGYRQHVDCGGPGGAYYPYNTGTMIAGAAELFEITGEDRYVTELSAMSQGSYSEFMKYQRTYSSYELKVDDTAENGFLTWFNDVLLRGMADAKPYCTNNSVNNALKYHQKNLDYAFDNHNRDGLLPIHLLTGWGEETKTKPFHQFTFVSEYSLLARLNLEEAAKSGIENIAADVALPEDDTVYNLNGVALGSFEAVKSTLRPGIYIVNGKKIAVK